LKIDGRKERGERREAAGRLQANRRAFNKEVLGGDAGAPSVMGGRRGRIGDGGLKQIPPKKESTVRN